MPNIFSCSTEWFEKLKDDQARVIIATWKERGGEKVNEFLERLQALEDEGIPVFVVDCDSCPTIAEKLKVTEDGEAIVFAHGVEKGRLTPKEDIEGSLKMVKELTT